MVKPSRTQRFRKTGSSGGKEQKRVEDPFNQSDERVFDSGTGKIRRILDRAACIATLTVDRSGDPATITAPELCQTSLRYDGSHRLNGGDRPGVAADDGGRTRSSRRAASKFTYVDRSHFGSALAGRSESADHFLRAAPTESSR